MRPEIQLQHFDPFYEATHLHFEDLSRRYLDPIVVLNLVKQRERLPHERVLGGDLRRAFALLNIQSPPEKAVDYIALDFTQVCSMHLFAEVVCCLACCCSHCAREAPPKVLG
jgi:hypothetical protein